MVNPESEFFHLGSRVNKAPDSSSGSATKNIFFFLTQRMLTKILKKCSGMFFPGSGFFPIQDPDRGVEELQDPGSGSATLYRTLRFSIFFCFSSLDSNPVKSRFSETTDNILLIQLYTCG
jgi:hypothetical protein